MDNYLIGKTAVVAWETYLAICKKGFVLDEEKDWKLLKKDFERIKELDPDAKAYASNHPIEKMNDEL